MPGRFGHLNYRILTALLIVALPLLGIGTFLTLGAAQAKLRESSGQRLAEVAEHTAAAVDAYVFRSILDMSVVARVPELRATALAASGQPLEPQAVRDIDRQWQQARTVPSAVSGLLISPASRFLQDVVTHDPIYREILLTDRHGRLAAASNIPSDYYQADEDWWREAYDDGVRGKVSVSDVRWDESARVYAIEVAVPVLEPGADRLAGILKIVADSRELLAAVGGARLGATGEAQLLREDGSIVFSRGTVAPSAQFFATDLLRERVRTLRAGDPQSLVSFSARGSDGHPRLVGVATSQLGRSYPRLAWLLAMTQSEDEVFAPLRSQAWYLLAVPGLTAIAVLVLALWFSMRLATPAVGIDMKLVEHPKVPHIGDTDEPQAGNDDLSGAA